MGSEVFQDLEQVEATALREDMLFAEALAKTNRSKAMTKTTQTRPTADNLNTILADGGMVMVCTYGRTTVYKSRHAGMFADRDGNLNVQRGHSWDCLSFGDRLLVGIRTSKV